MRMNLAHAEVDGGMSAVDDRDANQRGRDRTNGAVERALRVPMPEIGRLGGFKLDLVSRWRGVRMLCVVVMVMAVVVCTVPRAVLGMDVKMLAAGVLVVDEPRPRQGEREDEQRG